MLWDRFIRFNDLKLGNLFNNISQVLQSYSMGTGTMVGGLISYITVVDLWIVLISDNKKDAVAHDWYFI